MIIGAHPDDPDITGGGMALKFIKAGATVKMLAVCNGDKGHMSMPPEELAKRRFQETQRSAAILGVAEYQVLDNHDCELVADLEMRQTITRLIRKFGPHLIFTHRTCDYHADHRAVATAVMDSAYLLGVPHWCADTPIVKVKPTIYFLRDVFTNPVLRPDVMISIDAELDQLLTALCSHESQFFEWLAFDRRISEPIPADLEGRKAFIRKYWMETRKGLDTQRFKTRLTEIYGAEAAAEIRFAEAYELSEYGSQPDREELAELFPFFTDTQLDRMAKKPSRPCVQE